MTSSDKEIVEKVRQYEKSTLSDEKFCIAAKFFDCYMVDLENIEKDHPLLSMIKRPQPMSFALFFEGKVAGKSKQKATPSSIYSLCAKTIKKTHKVSLDKVVKEEQKILNELDKLNGRMENIKNTRLRKGDKISKRENLSLQEEEEEIRKAIGELKEKEAKLLTLPPKEVKVARS